MCSLRSLLIYSSLIMPGACNVVTYTKDVNNQYLQKKGRENKEWKLVWEDNFDGPVLDTVKWTKILPAKGEWSKWMTDDDKCYESKDGKILLKGMVNPDTLTDPRKYLTGGIYTKGKFAYQYGQVEIRAKLGTATGAWPAMWMLAANNKYREYPRNGEIDIMEHLNFDSIIYQTVHSYYTLNLQQDKNPPHSGTAKMKPDGFNIFGLKWYPDKLVFTLNGKETFIYPRLKEADPVQWPFDQPFYLMIDQQLGGNWVGKIKPEELPVQIEVDWVRVYQ